MFFYKKSRERFKGNRNMFEIIKSIRCSSCRDHATVSKSRGVNISMRYFLFFCVFFVAAMIYVAFAVCQYFYYTVMPVVMRLSSATVVNLSLLTSDLYTLLIGLLIFGYKVKCFLYIIISNSCLFWSYWSRLCSSRLSRL